MKNENCSACKFWSSIGEDEDGEEIGTCRRYPPVLRSLGSVEMEDKKPMMFDPNWWGQPEVYAYSWCGEFMPTTVPQNGNP